MGKGGIYLNLTKAEIMPKVTFELPEPMADALKAEAVKTDRSVSAVIRGALKTALAYDPKRKIGKGAK